ncbi:DUF1593 domain-containing protein, partial [bacterium]|nr:DUF1593 domain-containing protein [bacterium]
YGPGRKSDILKVIDCYEKDYPNLKTYSNEYPTPDELRTLTKQGKTDAPPYEGVSQASVGSDWIIQCARRDDPRPLYVLVWGGLEDLAQALHDAPGILPKLRVYWIGGPNKKWSPNAYMYIVDHHSDLWFIEANATYRGWFVGGNQSGEWGNKEFVSKHIAGKGALGTFFNTKLGGVIKMGDTPSVGWLLKGNPENPAMPGWGGCFVRAWERPYKRFERLTTKEDQIEEFGILEFALPLINEAPENPNARIYVENQELIGEVENGNTIYFRFCPKASKAYSFKIESNIPSFDGMTGGITSISAPPDAANRHTARLPNWWTDNPDPKYAEGAHIGAKTVNMWREEYLYDFAKRMDRCKSPNDVNK